MLIKYSFDDIDPKALRRWKRREGGGFRYFLKGWEIILRIMHTANSFPRIRSFVFSRIVWYCSLEEYLEARKEEWAVVGLEWQWHTATR